jgi:hypothetical protein
MSGHRVLAQHVAAESERTRRPREPEEVQRMLSDGRLPRVDVILLRGLEQQVGDVLSRLASLEHELALRELKL